MSLLDVETTAEALQEDEELIEAVEQFVETAASSIWSKIVADLEELASSFVAWMEWLIPLWVTYQQGELDLWDLLQKMAITLVLLVVSFVLLAPSKSRSVSLLREQRRRRQLLDSSLSRHSFRGVSSSMTMNSAMNSSYLRRHSSLVSISDQGFWQPQQAQAQAAAAQTIEVQPRINSNRRRPSSSICSGRVITVETEETDAERFEKNYPSLLMSRYRRLLLPPTCKLEGKPKKQVAKNKPITTTTSSSKKKKRRRKKRERVSDEDAPARRLALYIDNFIILLKHFATYDYMGAGMKLIRWIILVLRIRQIRRSTSTEMTQEDEEDDDDDESKASASVSVISVASQSQTSQQQNQQQQQQQRQSWVQYNNSSSQHQQTPERSELPQNFYLESNSNSNNHSQSQSSFATTEYGVEEKKESPLLTSVQNNNSKTLQSPPPPLVLDDSNRRGANAASTNSDANSVYFTPAQSSSSSTSFPDNVQVIGEMDEERMSNLRLPLSVSNKNPVSLRPSSTAATAATTSTTIGGGKKKDLLQNYRSSASSLLGASATATGNATNRNNTPQSQSLSSNTNHAFVHSSSSGDITTLHRNHHDENDVSNNDSILRQDGATATPQNIDTRQDANDEDSLGNSSSSDNDILDHLPAARLQRQRFDSDFSGFFFDSANDQETISQMNIDATLPDKNGYVLGDQFLPDSNSTPLLVFVNSRSGPQQGHLLITQLRRLLNPIQVWDLGEDGSPESVLESFTTAFHNLRILVCGGDGTVSWIIATLEKLNLKRKWPPIAILPLGTGNDLARIHGWGGGYNNESLIGILEDVAESYISLLDQWELTIENRKGKVKDVKSFFNYLGVGADAQAALQVHMLRESRPQLFFSRVVNKAWYGIFGAEDIIKATSLNLPNEITLIADGVEVPLPADSQGIILLNIDSYSGGAPFWATGVKHDRRHGYNHQSSSEMNGTQNHGTARAHRPGHLRRTRSLEDLTMRRHETGHMPRIDSVEDLSQIFTDDHQRWEHVTACDLPSSCQDGVLDIVSVRGAFHLGQIRVGLSSAERLCQCREATIHIKRKVAVQIDGEPWRQNICTLRVKRKPERAIMLHKSQDKNGVETEVANLLDWAEKRRLIDGNVHYAMMKEFSRRIEHKTRQRRNSRKPNMFSLQRAMGSTGAISGYEGSYEYPM